MKSKIMLMNGRYAEGMSILDGLNDVYAENPYLSYLKGLAMKKMNRPDAQVFFSIGIREVWAKLIIDQKELPELCTNCSQKMRLELDNIIKDTVEIAKSKKNLKDMVEIAKSKKKPK